MIGWDAIVGEKRVMAILRGLSSERAVAIAEELWTGGIELIEVTIGDPRDSAVLRAVTTAAAAHGRPVGAGTVTTVEQVRAAAGAGALFTVAPGLDLSVVEASVAAGMPHLPGVATGTEVQRAVGAGCTWLKAFPAVSLGPDWFRAMRGPFPHVQFVATGGVNADNAGEFLNAGARLVGVGLAIADAEQRAAFMRRTAGASRRGNPGTP